MKWVTTAVVVIALGLFWLFAVKGGGTGDKG